MFQIFHPFLRGKDECDLFEFPGASGGVREWGGVGNGESGGRVKRDTADGRDAGFHTHFDYLNRRRPGTAEHGTGMRCSDRRKRLDHLVESGQLPGLPMSDTEPRRMEEDSIPHRYPAV